MNLFFSILLAVVVLMKVGEAQAWTAAYTWDTVATATSYRVDRSVDAGITWTTAGTPTVPAFTYSGTETGLVLFRVSACNASGCGTRATDGLWHFENAPRPPAPPGQATNQRVQ